MPSSSSSVAQRRRARLVDRGGAAGEHQRPRRRARVISLDRDVVGQQLGEDAALADPPGDQLRVLAAEVEDEHLLARDRRPSRAVRRARPRGVRRAPASSAAMPRPQSSETATPLDDGGLAVRAHADRLLALELLALGLQRRRDHHLGAVERGDVLVAAGRHRGPQRAHQVEGAVVLAGPGRAGSARACRPGGW